MRKAWVGEEAAREAGYVRARVLVQGSHHSGLAVFMGCRLARYFRDEPLRLVARELWRFSWISPDMSDPRWADMFWGRQPGELASPVAGRIAS